MSRPSTTPSPNASILLILGALVFILLCGVAGVAGCKSFNRYQKRSDAKNSVQLTHIAIDRARQQARINNAQIAATKAEARKRFAEAQGIRKAQDEIQATLTERYIQHEAIQAQKAIATSGRNNTVIYVPSGTNGTPLITQQAKP